MGRCQRGRSGWEGPCSSSESPYPKDFRGSAKRKTLVFSWVSLAFFQKGKGRRVREDLENAVRARSKHPGENGLLGWAKLPNASVQRTQSTLTSRSAVELANPPLRIF